MKVIQIKIEDNFIYGNKSKPYLCQGANQGKMKKKMRILLINN